MQNKCMEINFDERTGGIEKVVFLGDEFNLNWVEGDKTHGTPYGNYSLISAGQTSEHEYTAIYGYKNLVVKVLRKLTEWGLINRYIFENQTKEEMFFSFGELGITMPFNDNYESSDICIDHKCHTHIWTGEASTYVACKRMSGKNNNLGVVLSRGTIGGYAINRQTNSNDRGDMTMLLPESNIPTNGNITVEFLMFKYDNFSDFYAKILQCPNFLQIDAPKYSLYRGESVKVKIKTLAQGDINSNYGNIAIKNNEGSIDVKFDTIGEHKLQITYGDNLSTYAEFYVYEDIVTAIDRRLNFIIDKQQIRMKGKFDGAVMLYDNDTNSTFVENTPINDRNFARERMGMMTSLAERLLRDNLQCEDKDKYLKSLADGIKFIDRQLIKDNGKVYEKPTYKRMPFHDRLYNYSWAMTFYITLYELYNEKNYLYKACNIARTYYRKGGHKFYAINLPLSRIVDNCFKSQYLSLGEEMKTLFLQHGDRLIDIGINYPPHEVKYEQSIVAPSVDILIECYLISNDRKYLDEVERQLPLLEAFNGIQPSFHMNEVAIRHWDGYWFGKSKLYGDTFPHYWSCITAMVYSKYAKISGNACYQNKADKCLLNNLCLIHDGKGSCAYLAPDFVNGKPGKFYDAWANDQDWLIWYNLKYNSKIN